MAWVDNYCKANPLAKVTTGAAILVQELRERAQPEVRASSFTANGCAAANTISGTGLF